MKTNDIKALHDKSLAELNVELEKTNQSLAMARLNKSAGKLTDVTSVHRLSHDIAVVKTIIREKEILNKLKESQPKKPAAKVAKVAKVDKAEEK